MRVNWLKHIAAFAGLALASASIVHAQNPTKADVEAELARLSAIEVQAVACGRGDLLVQASVGISVAMLDARIKAGMITGVSGPIRVAPKAPAPCDSEADQIAQGDGAFSLWETLSISNAYLVYSRSLPWAKLYAVAPDGWLQQATELEAQFSSAFAKAMPPEELTQQTNAFNQTAQFDVITECARRKANGCPALTGIAEDERKLSEIRFNEITKFPFATSPGSFAGSTSAEDEAIIRTPAFAFEGKSSDKRGEERYSGSHNCHQTLRFLIFPLARPGARPPGIGRETLPLYDSDFTKVGTAIVQGVDTFRYKLISAQIDASAIDEYTRPKLEGGTDFLLCLRTAS